MQLKKLSFWLSSTALLALAVMGFLLFKIWLAFYDVEAAQTHRRQAITLDAQLQTETEQLTRLVRLYVVTGQPLYLMCYFEIIAIQQGEAQEPANFNSLTYWDQVIAGSIVHKRAGPGSGIALTARMQTLGFTPPELAAMHKVLAAREAMNQLEQIAFASMEGLYDPASGTYVSDGRPDRAYATGLVHSRDYNLRKAAQSAAMQALVDATNQRTQDERTEAAARLERLILLSLACMGGLIVIIVTATAIVRLQVVKPLHRLKIMARRMAAGEYVKRVDDESEKPARAGKKRRDRRRGSTRGVTEIAVLDTTLSSMAAAIDSDLRARRAVQDELERARETAEAATRSKSQFLANMSHEIRTPMNAIIGMTYLALQTELSARQQDYIGKAHGAARALLGIINSILDFSKIEAGKIRLEHAPFRLEDVLGNAILLLRQAASEKELELLLECDDARLLGGRLPLLGDALRLGEVLTNLLSNAVKFTDQGSVALKVDLLPAQANDAPDSVGLQFTVQDSGIGIPPAQAGSLFDEFAQADASTTRRFGGTGLGLFIAKRLVTLMDGRIWVEPAEAGGSCFHFTVRLQLAQDDDSLQIDSSVLPQVGKLRLLVVDDHAPAADSLAALLRALGCGRVEVAHSASAALALLHDPLPPYDLVLADAQLPDMDGATLLARLGAAGAANRQRPQAVLLSGSDSQLLREHANGLEVQHFLSKPALPGELRELLNLVLGVKQERRSLAPAGAGDGRLRGMRVLLVEDHAINRQLAQELMTGWGVSCELAEHGKAALALLAGAPPAYFHLLLTDLQMPVMDGYQMTSILRADARYDQLPIVALSADVLAEERERCTLLGMNDHLGKPLEPEQLFALLGQYFQDRRRPLAPVIDLYAIEGLNADDGLRRAGGRLPAYRQMLVLFGAEFAAAPETLAQLLADGEWKAAHSIAHTMKGLAGTIGAGPLAIHAGRLEHACAAHDPAASQLLAALVDCLAPLLARLPREEGQPVHEHETAVLPDPALLQRLRELLAQSNSAALPLWELHQRAFYPLLSRPTLHLIGQALKNIDFEQALALLPESLPDAVSPTPHIRQN